MSDVFWEFGGGTDGDAVVFLKKALSARLAIGSGIDSVIFCEGAGGVIYIGNSVTFGFKLFAFSGGYASFVSSIKNNDSGGFVAARVIG